MKKYCYFNGKIITQEKIRINPYDLGMMRGYGIFDVMRADEEKPFLIKDHFERLKNSAKSLNLKMPFDFVTFSKIVPKLLRLSKNKKSAVRTIITGGVSSDSITLGSHPTCYILVEKFHALPPEIYARGAKVITLEYQREHPEVKSTSYIISIKNQTLKKRKQALEILYLKSGRVLEGSSSNVFLLKDGVLITSKKNILAGCTRKAVLKVARKKFKIEERDILERELYEAQEIFITGSIKGLVPIVKVNDKKVGTGKVGEITQAIVQLYEEFVKKA